jgi:hypothetical protein
MNQPIIEPTPLNTAQPLACWALLEIFGHHKVAGRLTERKMGTASMFQVDVPKGDDGFSHSELYGPGAIFAIKPTTEEWCRQFGKAYEAADQSPLPYVPQGTPAIPDRTGDYPEDQD